MNIGLEHIVGATDNVDTTPEAIAIAQLEYVEAGIVCDNMMNELNGVITLQSNLEDICVTVKEHGATEALVSLIGADFEALSPDYANKDQAAICADIVVSIEGLGKKIIAGIKAMIKKIKDFIIKIIKYVKSKIKMRKKQPTIMSSNKKNIDDFIKKSGVSNEELVAVSEESLTVLQIAAIVQWTPTTDKDILRLKPYLDEEWMTGFPTHKKFANEHGPNRSLGVCIRIMNSVIDLLSDVTNAVAAGDIAGDSPAVSTKFVGIMASIENLKDMTLDTTTSSMLLGVYKGRSNVFDNIGTYSIDDKLQNSMILVPLETMSGIVTSIDKLVSASSEEGASKLRSLVQGIMAVNTGVQRSVLAIDNVLDGLVASNKTIAAEVNRIIGKSVIVVK